MRRLIAALFAASLTAISLPQERAAPGPQQPQSAPQGFYQDLGWSPDGSKISFSWNGEGNFEIYVMQSDGSSVTNLTRNAASDRYATWSPDGSKIVFESNRDGDRKDQLYIVSIDGSKLRRLTRDDTNNVFPGFAPDAKRILFGSGRPAIPGDENKIYVMRKDGSERKELADRGFFARWSPRGDRIAFIAGHYPLSTIYIMKADGSGKRQLR